MTINDKIFELISEMEYIVSNETLSQSTFIGAGISADDYTYRYPVRISLDNNLDESKTQVRSKVHTFKLTWYGFDDNTNEKKVIHEIKATPDIIDTMYYAFGSHRLYIGNALVKILELLENRYGIDFNKLENELPTK